MAVGGIEVETIGTLQEQVSVVRLRIGGECKEKTGRGDRER